MNKKRTIRRIENIIGFISIIMAVTCMGSIIAMVEAGKIITGSLIIVIVGMVWFGIIAAYNYIVGVNMLDKEIELINNIDILSFKNNKDEIKKQ